MKFATTVLLTVFTTALALTCVAISLHDRSTRRYCEGYGNDAWVYAIVSAVIHEMIIAVILLGQSYAEYPIHIRSVLVWPFLVMIVVGAFVLFLYVCADLVHTFLWKVGVMNFSIWITVLCLLSSEPLLRFMYYYQEY